ncbi:hypothetical protein BDM02DRAFT_3264038 [Thelephora ganbajun]|uniref:Uncharacterized protein n=1 Tax=Thelephora ganbajun TaxID=370292 RepID=A0ACB6Z222_THEGA|nr:hypothetical protein BDM02DRAFT_3264038 [Thelephora ganbajun]
MQIDGIDRAFLFGNHLPLATGVHIGFETTPGFWGRNPLIARAPGEVERAHTGPFCATFDPPSLGGQNHNFHDCARPQRAVVSPFGAPIWVCIYEGIAPLPRRRVYFFCLGRYGRI